MSKTASTRALILASESPGRREPASVGRERQGLHRPGQTAEGEDLGTGLDRAHEQLASRPFAHVAPGARAAGQERTVG